MNQQAMLRKVRQMQQEMIKTQEEISNADFVQTAGGVVKVTLKGTKELVNVEILDGFEIESMIIDIMSLVLGLIGSSLICAHIYRFKENIKLSYIASLILIIAIAVLTSYYDVNPSHVDLFYDHQNHTYERVTE